MDDRHQMIYSISSPEPKDLVGLGTPMFYTKTHGHWWFGFKEKIFESFYYIGAWWQSCIMPSAVMRRYIHSSCYLI